jgi:hypothetical protein
VIVTERTPETGRLCANLLFAAATTCHAPLALVAVVEPDGQWSMLRYGPGSGGLPVDDGLFGAVGRGFEPLEIGDLLRHPQFGGTDLATSPLGIRSVYGLPLRAQGGSLLGVLCVFDRCVRRLSNRERDGLDAIASKIALRLATTRRSDAGRLVADDRQPRGGADRPTAPRAPDFVPAGNAIPARLLHSKDVAAIFDVTERTVANWAKGRRLPSFRTAGGHLRFQRADVLALQDRPW